MCVGTRSTVRPVPVLASADRTVRVRRWGRERSPVNRQAKVSPSERRSSEVVSVAATTRNELAMPAPRPAATT